MITVILQDWAGVQRRVPFNDWRKAWAYVGLQLLCDRAKKPLRDAFPTLLKGVI